MPQNASKKLSDSKIKKESLFSNSLNYTQEWTNVTRQLLDLKKISVVVTKNALRAKKALKHAFS